MRMDRYDKAAEVWYLLHTIEQLIIHDKDYHPNVINSINDCIDIVETLQRSIETSNS